MLQKNDKPLILNETIFQKPIFFPRDPAFLLRGRSERRRDQEWDGLSCFARKGELRRIGCLILLAVFRRRIGCHILRRLL
jgi:hypothetical protein